MQAANVRATKGWLIGSRGCCERQRESALAAQAPIACSAQAGGHMARALGGLIDKGGGMIAAISRCLS